MNIITQDDFMKAINDAFKRHFPNNSTLKIEHNDQMSTVSVDEKHFIASLYETECCGDMIIKIDMSETSCDGLTNHVGDMVTIVSTKSISDLVEILSGTLKSITSKMRKISNNPHMNRK